MNTVKNDTIQRVASREDVLGLIYAAFTDVNLDLPLDQQLALSESTRLGLGGTVDSLTLITILVSVEKQIAKQLGVTVQLLADAELLGESNPLQNAGRLATFLTQKIENRLAREGRSGRN